MELYISNYHHHHVVDLSRISLTLSRHSSLSFIASGKSSGLHPVSSQSCCMYVRAGRPAFARPYVGVHWSTSLMSSSLLFLQCPACLVRLTWIVFVMGGRWPYSWCLVGYCRQDLFNIARKNHIFACRLKGSQLFMIVLIVILCVIPPHTHTHRRPTPDYLKVVKLLMASDSSSVFFFFFSFPTRGITHFFTAT